MKRKRDERERTEGIASGLPSESAVDPGALLPVELWTLILQSGACYEDGSADMFFLCAMKRVCRTLYQLVKADALLRALDNPPFVTLTLAMCDKQYRETKGSTLRVHTAPPLRWAWLCAGGLDPIDSRIQYGPLSPQCTLTDPLQCDILASAVSLAVNMSSTNMALNMLFVFLLQRVVKEHAPAKELRAALCRRLCS